MQQGNEDASHLLRWLAVAMAVISGLLIMVPLAPGMPDLSLDGAWRTAVNVANANGLVFGRDFIFTAGPYAAIYTRMYLPATDRFMLVSSLCVSGVMLAALVACVPASRRLWLFGLPMLMTLPGMGDAMFICMPWLLILLASRGHARDKRWWFILLHLTVATCALLPLVKGSFTITAVACTAIASLIVSRTSRSHAFLMPATFVIALIVEWSISGQPLIALPAYFLTQADIIAGYGDAMSASGPVLDVVLVVVASVLLAVAYFGARGPRKLTWLGAMLTTFIGFKAGLVRHDSFHAVIAASTILIVAMPTIFVMRSWPWRACVLTAVALAFVLLSRWAPMSPLSIVDRTANTLANSVMMGVDRLNGAPLLQRQYREAVALMRALAPLPSDGRSADVFTVGASVVTLGGERWAPRPIIQSYSAYTPTLIERNTAYLRQAGPARIYWQVYTPDFRYPTLDDGASWRWLLGGYRPVDRRSDFVVLENTGRPSAVATGAEVVSAHPSLGEAVDLPTNSPLWATISLKPTLLGRLRSLLFKAPEVHLVVIYPDHGAEYRVIPGMMETGFLISPTIGTTGQLQSFLANGFEGAPRHRIPQKFILEVSGGGTWFEEHYAVSVKRLVIPAATVGPSFLDQPEPAEDRYARGGDCLLETFDGDPLDGDTVTEKGGVLAVTGLSWIDIKSGIASDGASLLVTDAAGNRRVVPARNIPRSDMARQFGPAFLNSGFSAAFSLAGIVRPLKVTVLIAAPTGKLECQSQTLHVQ